MAVVVAVTVAVPPGAVPDNGRFPLGWLSWFVPRAGSAAPRVPGVPAQRAGTAVERGHHVGAARTDARRGSGRAPKAVTSALPAYQPHSAETPRRTTPRQPAGFVAGRSQRLAGKSSATSDVYRNPDGSFTKRVYGDAVNYRAADGTWRAVDPALEPDGGGRLRMKASGLRATLTRRTADPASAAAAADLVSLTLPGGQSFAYGLAGAAPVDAETRGSTATYRGVLPHTDLELNTFGDMVKETLVLTSPDAPSSWLFPLRLNGLTARLTSAGSVELRDASGTAVAWLPPGSMEDSKVDPRSGAPAHSDAVTYQLVTTAGGTALKVTADRRWLRDPARAYPVRVDPTIELAVTGDAYVDNDTSTTNQNGNNLPVGTFNGGTVKARSFVQVRGLRAAGLDGKRITAANLHLFHTWSYDCTTHLPFSVHRVTQDWAPADLGKAKYPGPAISGSIGSLTITNNYPACENNDGDRSVGRWVSVPLQVATLNDWSSGGDNFGLGLTASESDSRAWKRFTSSNHAGGGYAPYLDMTYVDNTRPQVDVRYPANNAVVPTLTPELVARGKDSDAYPGKGLKYAFVVYDETGTVIVDSKWVTTSSWTVPRGRLAWNRTYQYTVQVTDEVTPSAVYPAYAFTTGVPQPLVTANLAQNADKGFDPRTGNYTTSATDAEVNTIGPSLSIVRSYNSLDTRRSGAFGAGWSSVLDTRVSQVVDVSGTVQSAVVTYPTGQAVAFGRKPDGSFVAPPGRFARMAETADAAGAVTGYTLTDKDETVYAFGRTTDSRTFGISSITDANGRRLAFGYDAAGTLTRITSSSGRSLQLTWTTPSGGTAPHVATISTDPATAGAPETAAVWRYGYGTADRLESVCPPTDPARCTSYRYAATSQHVNTVLDAGPLGYWRLNEGSGTVAASAVLANAGVDNARYVNVALGQSPALAGSTSTSAGFNGTSSYVQLPGKLISDGQYQSVGMWFRTTSTNGVLFSYSADPISKGTTTSNYTPALYIGSDGKLRGEFWQGSASPLTTSAAVNDGAWHHVMLSGAGDTQTLYLDGVARGTLAGTIFQFAAGGANNITVGAGFMGGGWPGHAKSGSSPAVASYFTGSISDVAFFNQPLTAQTVGALYAAGKTASSSLDRITRPSGGVTAEIGYDTVTGKVGSVTDQNGGRWTLGAPAVTGNSDVYAAAVLGAKPDDYWRMGDVDAVEAANEVQGGSALYSGVTLGVAGPFADSKAASFDGTAGFVELPAGDVPATGPNSVEMFFKMPSGSVKGGTLFSFQSNPVDTGAVADDFVPALYVGSDGKLRGKWCWCAGQPAPITSSAAVNDGKWHHAALTLSGTAQKLYLDGTLVGSLAVAPPATTAQHAYVGAGFVTGWPAAPANARGYFPGEIAEVAFYSSEISAEQVAAHLQASKQTVPVEIAMVSGVATKIAMPVQTVTVTGPVGERVSYSYDLVNGGRMVAQRDALGNTTQYGYDIGGYGSLVYDERGVWTQELHDARGNTIQNITCQDQEANRCSSSYYTYYPDATSTKLPPDARNDLLLTMRDGRSASATDNTYRTTIQYDGNGNQTGVIDPLGRATKTEYTTSTTPAYGGGLAPAGLPAKTITAGGAVTTISYFPSGDVAEVVDPAGKRTRYTYDGLGRILTETEVTDTFPNGVVTSYTYDALDRVVTQTDPALTNRVTGAVHTARTTSSYDPDGKLLATTTSDLTGGDAPRTESHAYNEYGQQESTTDASGATTGFTYDSYGNVLEEREADGGLTRNTYDAEDRLLTTVVSDFTGDPNNPRPARDLVVSSRTYDPAGRLASETDAMNWTTRYAYTDNGLLAKVTRTDGTSTFVLRDSTYDPAGNLLTEITNDGATTTAHTYDAAGQELTSTLDPAGLARVVKQGYDRDGNVVSSMLSDASGARRSTEAMYDRMGRLLAETTLYGDFVPVGRWRLDETSGSVAADVAGNAPLTGTDVTWSAEHGGSAAFNGTSSYLSAIGPVVDTGRSFSVSAWVLLSATGANRTAVGQDDDADSGFRLQSTADGNWSFGLRGEESDTAVATTAPATTGTWTHLTGVYDAGRKSIRLYVDGNAASTATVSGRDTATGPFTIGRGKRQGEYGDYWSGGIGEVRVYPEALTDAQVTRVHNGTAPYGVVTRTSYDLDQNGQPRSETDPNGNTTYYAYDEDGNLTQTAEPAVTVESAGQAASTAVPITVVGYNTFGERTDETDPHGNWTVTGYDAGGRVVSERLPSYTPPGSSTAIRPETTYAYDVMGRQTSVTNPLDRVTRYAYDQLGRLARETAPDDGVTTYTYDDAGDLLTETSPSGAVAARTYDYLGRTLTATDAVRQTAASYTTAYRYGTGGWLAEARSPAGVTTSTVYNAAGEPTAVTDGAGNVTRYAYDAAGALVKTTNPDGTYTTVGYDLGGRPTDTASFSAAGTSLVTQSTQYDRAGQVVATVDGRRTTTKFTYDAAGQLVKEVQPITESNSIKTSFGYDLTGNRTRFTDGRGNEFWTTYNSWGLPESVIEPATTAHPQPADRTFTTVYDAAGQTVGEKLPGGVSIANSYDQMGRLTKQVGVGAEAATQDREFGYDGDGRMTSFSAPGGTNTVAYDDRDLPTSMSGPSGDASFRYDEDGRLRERSDAAGTTAFGYDNAGRLAEVNNAATNVRQAYTYNAMSLIARITYAASGDTRTFSYDDLHRPVRDELTSAAGSSIAKIAYGWDDNGNLTEKTTTGFGGSTTNTYGYDLANRLTSWNNGTATTSYGYDKSGNRTAVGGKKYTYDERNRLLTGDGITYNYTARGTLASAKSGGTTLITTADAFGQVVSQGSAVGLQTYGYDALGRVLRPGFAYSGAGNDLATDGIARYTRDPDGGLLGAATDTTQRTVWTDLHTDVVGQFSPGGTTLDGATTYDPLGQVLATNGMIGNLGYQSEWTDPATGRVNMWARWYNPVTAQFDTRDSVENSPIPDSISANRYEYGDGEPLTMTDPSGHSVLGWFTGGMSRAWNWGRSTISRGYHAFSRGYHKFRSWGSRGWRHFKHGAKRLYHAGKRAYHRVKHAVHRAKHAIKKAYHKVRHWAGRKIHQAKRKLVHAYHKVKQKGAHIVAAGARKLNRLAHHVKDSIDHAKHWVKRHKNEIIEVAAVVAGVAAGVACAVLTAGAAAVACAVGTAALVNLGKDTMQGNVHSWRDAGMSLASGAVTGLMGAGAGAVAGRVAGAVVKGALGKAAGSLGGRMFAGGLSGAGSDAGLQLATTGRVDWRGVAMSAGIGAAFGGFYKGKNPCSRHSFGPETRVLMADGSTRPIKHVAVGDKVVATDPATGSSTVRAVTKLHVNRDTDLTDVTVTVVKPTTSATADAGTAKAKTRAAAVQAANARVAKSRAAAKARAAAVGAGVAVTGAKKAVTRKAARLAAAGAMFAGLAVGATVVLHTTAHHPFWDQTASTWVDAGSLAPGHELHTLDGATVVVAAVNNRAGAQLMRDLTVDSTHTYYVIAGKTPVLVHNNNGEACRIPAGQPGAGRFAPNANPRTPDQVNENGMLTGTNQPGYVTSRPSLRTSTERRVWGEAAVGPNGGRMCRRAGPNCVGEVMVPPGSSQNRDWDYGHDQGDAWSNTEFPPSATREEVIDRYHQGGGVECIPCNRGAGAD